MKRDNLDQAARPNDVIVKEFLDTIVKIVSEGSSYQYILMVLRKFMESHIEIFPFIKYLQINSDGIAVDKKINSVDPQLIGKLLKVLVNTMFSDLFMHLVKKKLPKGLSKDLDNMGVSINS